MEKYVFNILAGVTVALLITILRKFYNQYIWALMRLLGNKKLIFVSTGGTCRDPMAKIITEQLFKRKNIKNVRVYAVGLGDVTSKHASKAAQLIISEYYGSNLLKHHRPKALTAKLAREADLILCMENTHVKTISKLFPTAIGKTKLLKPYFGLTGEIGDPYRVEGEVDANAISRYRNCFEELRSVLTDNISQLAELLAV